MKHFFLGVSLITAVAAQAQVTKKPTTTKPAAKPAAKPTTTAVKPLKNASDSVSYAIGLQVAKFYKQQGITNISTDALSKAIKDVMGNKPELLTEAQSNEVIMMTLTPGLAERLAEGKKFLAENKKKPGVMTTPSGLQYEVVTLGTGSKPTPADQVVVNYAGKLVNGSEFDNSYKRGEPITFGVGQVIKGWTEGLQLMPAGSKFKFYIPQELGYGMAGAGEAIPGGSVLIFDVELLSITPKQ